MRLLLLLTLLVLPQSAVAQTDQPWDGVTSALHTDKWSEVNVISFTFKHHSGATRHHEWWVKKHIVRVTIDGKTTEIPINAADLRTDAEIAAHKWFTNDSYWFLFEFHIGWDHPKLEDLGPTTSPFGGKAKAFRVSYPAQGGYTPGDAYVGFIGQDGKLLGWSYHPGGAKKAKLTTTRGSYKPFGPLVLPTRFETPDGKLFVEFTNVAVR